MTKSEYMEALQERLQHYNRALEMEILEDYEQHFAEGLAEGRSEEEIIAELGNIEDMLQEFSREDLKQELEAVESQANQSNSYRQLYRAVVIEGLLADVDVSASPDDRIRIAYDNNGSKAQKLRYQFYQYEDDGVFYAGVKERKQADFRGEAGGGMESLREVVSMFSNFKSWSSEGDINLRVQIPAGIPLVRLHNTSGDLKVSELNTRELETQCTSGDLQIQGVICQKLSAKTQSGDQQVSGVSLTVQEETEIGLHTASGDMEIQGISAAKICLSTANGDLNGKRLNAGDLKIQTSSGDVELRDAESARTALRTGNGDISVCNLRGVEMSAEAGSGDLELQADAESLEVKTGSGDVDLEAGSGARLVHIIAGSGDICLNLGHVEGATIVARTGSGDMRIRGQGASGRHHSVSYGSGACQVSLVTGSGDIKVR